MSGRGDPPVITVAVVDDQPLLVSAFVALINNEPDLQVVGTAGDGTRAVEMIASAHPDVVLMDLRMPGLDGVTATERIVGSGSRARVLVLTTFNVDELVVGAIAAGARGFLLKDAAPKELLDGIRRVHRGEAVVSSEAAPYLFARIRDDSGVDDSVVADLTPREIEVLTLVGRGRTNSEIAAELFVAETTVKTHIANLLQKLGARDRVALVTRAYAAGLV